MDLHSTLYLVLSTLAQIKSCQYNYKSDAIITNIHSDTTYFENDIPMQGPFTETWVGGHQSRHVEINRFDTTKVTEGGSAYAQQPR